MEATALISVVRKGYASQQESYFSDLGIPFIRQFRMSSMYETGPQISGSAGGILPLFDQTLRVLKPHTLADFSALLTTAVVVVAYLLRGRAWDKPDPYYHLWFERPQVIGSNQAHGGKSQTRNINERIEELAKDVVVFWGSQSGTSEGFANRLVRELHQRLGLEAMAADLSDYDPPTVAQIPENKTAIFILSTYGEGDPSDNAAQFLEWLDQTQRDAKHTQLLKSLRFAAFGLGNSDYQYYNRVVDSFEAAVEACGAQRLMPTGKADDSHGATEEDFLAWKDTLFTVLSEHLGVQDHEPKYEPTIEVLEDESLQEADLFQGEPVHPTAGSGKQANSPIKALRVRHARELFTSTERNCLHLELDLTSNPQLSYKTGDHVAIWPINPSEEMERLLRVLGMSSRRTTPLLLRALDTAIKVKVPSPTNLEALLRYYLEICAPIPRDIVRGLAEFAPSSAAKEFLLDLGKTKESYAKYLERTHLNLGRLLELAGQVCQENLASQVWDRLPLSYLIDALPRTQPRFYSISSSSIISPRVPSVTALVSNTHLSSGAAIPGLTTNYLLSLASSMRGDKIIDGRPAYDLAGPSQALEGGRVYGHIRRSVFKLPMQASCPLIMVAAGTGLAPFRAFIAERSRLQSVGKVSGEMLLFFGCRDPREDYIYHDELEDMRKELGGKLRIVTAFSRLKGTKKVYVQDLIHTMSSEVVDMLHNSGASLYICGRASMAREVGKVLGEAMKTGMSGWSDSEVKEWRESMKRTRKWQEDVWG